VRRLAIGTTLAAHDRNRALLRHLVEDLLAGLMPMLIEALTALANEGLNAATRDPDTVREALAGGCPGTSLANNGLSPDACWRLPPFRRVPWGNS
jgi:hypothetical protein